MTKAKHYSKAKLHWNNTAYCDQWQKVMAIYDERDNLRAVIKAEDDDGMFYSVLLIGDDEVKLYEFNKIEIGSTSKNLKACFEIYRRLQYEDTPSYTPSYRRTKQINLYQIFTHTRTGARRNGSFHVTTENIRERITKALKYFEEVENNVKILYCYDTYSEYADDVYDLDAAWNALS